MPQPSIQTANGKRFFACSPAAVIGYIVNENEEILFLSNPKRPGWWENVNGALDAGESVLDGVLWEIGEEAGPEIRLWRNLPEDYPPVELQSSLDVKPFNKYLLSKVEVSR